MNIGAALALRRSIVFRYWSGLLFSGMFIGIIFMKLDLAIFLKGWGQLNYLWLAPACTLTLLSCILQTLRWQTILGDLGSYRFGDLFPSVMIGHLGNHILPAKAGEFIKSFHLGDRAGLSMVTVFSTIVLERIFDGVMVISFLLLFIAGLSQSTAELSAMGWVGAILYGSAFIVVTAIFKFHARLVTLNHRILPPRLAAWGERFIESFWTGLQVLKNFSQLLKVMGWSVAMWLVITTSIMTVLSMFDFSLPPYAPVAILACISLGLTVPSAPGGIGLISFATIFAMNILLDEMGRPMTETVYSQVVILSILINIVLVVPEIVVGTVFAVKTNARLTDLYQRKQRVGEADDPTKG